MDSGARDFTILNEAWHQLALSIAPVRPVSGLAASVVEQAASLFAASSAVLWLRNADGSWNSASHPPQNQLPPSPAAWELSAFHTRRMMVAPSSRHIGAHDVACLLDDTGQAQMPALLVLCGVPAGDHLEKNLALFAAQAAVSVANCHLFEQLQNAKREWEMTFDGMPEGICIEDEYGVVLRANLAVASLLELPLSEIIGAQIDQLRRSLPAYELLQTSSLANGFEAPLEQSEFRFGQPSK
ncbi:MAG TPA: PAS domain-containing protein, partial [Abditibacteriaceae bacterium]